MQIRGIEENLARMQLARDERDVIAALNDRNAVLSCNGEKPKLFGPPVIVTSVDKSKFKSQFGEPPKIEKSKMSLTGSVMINKKRKPASFFETQRLHKS